MKHLYLQGTFTEGSTVSDARRKLAKLLSQLDGTRPMSFTFTAALGAEEGVVPYADQKDIKDTIFANAYFLPNKGAESHDTQRRTDWETGAGAVSDGLGHTAWNSVTSTNEGNSD